MNKIEFLNYLKNTISQLPKSEISKQVEYYSDLIDIYVGYGLSEKEAVELLGTQEEISRDILLHTNIFILMKSFFIREDGRKMDKSGKAITILTSPLWALSYILIFFVAFIISLLIQILMMGLILVLLVFGYSGIKIILSGVTMILTNLVSFTTYLGLGLMLIGVTLFLYSFIKKILLRLNEYLKNIEVSVKKIFILRS